MIITVLAFSLHCQKMLDDRQKMDNYIIIDKMKRFVQGISVKTSRQGCNEKRIYLKNGAFIS